MFWIEAEGLLATACGYGPEQIDAMTLPRFHRLYRYWSAHPPLHLLVDAYFRALSRKPQQQDLGELLAMAKATGGALQS